jgi:hypothetical protein
MGGESHGRFVRIQVDQMAGHGGPATLSSQAGG